MSATTTHITVRVPLKIRRRPGRKMMVTSVPAVGGDTALPTRTDPALVKALARAFRYQRMLDEGRYSSVSEMAVSEAIDRGYLGRILRLALLAPDIVTAILDGHSLPGVTLPQLLKPCSADWIKQRKLVESR